ncbi:MAG: hypothetical protein R6U78_03820 [Bacteroidales bacterium]
MESTLFPVKRGFTIIISLLALLIAVSCSPTRRISVEDQRRGLLMLEGERIYRNKGFYKQKKSHKQRKKNLKASKRRYK